MKTLLRPPSAQQSLPPSGWTRVGARFRARTGTASLRRVGASTVGAALLLLVALSTITLSSTRDAMDQQLVARAQEGAGAAAAYVEARWGAVATTLTRHSRQADLIRLVQTGPSGRPALQSILTDIQRGDPAMTVLSVISPAGTVQAATSTGQKFIGFDVRSRDYFRGVVRTGKTYVSTAYLGALDVLFANVITPIRSSPGGAPIGYLNAAESLVQSQAFVRTFAHRAGLGLTVTDQSGATLASTGNSTLGRVDPSNERWLAAALSGKAGTASVRSGGEDAVVAYVPTRFGWVVAAQLPESTVTGPINRLRNTTVLLTIGLGLVVIVTALLLHRANRRREQEQQAEQLERQRIAREMNDTIVQRLVAAEMTYDIGRTDEARQMLRTASRQARDWVGELLLEAGTQPGTARRSGPVPTHSTEEPQ